MLIYPISICLTPVLMCFILSIPFNSWLEEVKSAMLAETRDPQYDAVRCAAVTARISGKWVR